MYHHDQEKCVSYRLEKEHDLEESHMLDSGRRLKKLNFHKAPWPEIQTELRKLDLAPMEDMAKESPVAAHAWLMDQIIPLLEKLLPLEGPKKKGRNRSERSRNLLWRRLSKIQRRIQTTCFRTNGILRFS